MLTAAPDEDNGQIVHPLHVRRPSAPDPGRTAGQPDAQAVIDGEMWWRKSVSQRPIASAIQQRPPACSRHSSCPSGGFPVEDAGSVRA